MENLRVYRVRFGESAGIALDPFNEGTSDERAMQTDRQVQESMAR